MTDAPATAPRSSSSRFRPPVPIPIPEATSATSVPPSAASARCTARYCATPSRGYACVAVWGLKPAWATRPAAVSCQAGLARPSVNGKPRDAARPSPVGVGAWSVQAASSATPATMADTLESLDMFILLTVLVKSNLVKSKSPTLSLGTGSHQVHGAHLTCGRALAYPLTGWKTDDYGGN